MTEEPPESENISYVFEKSVFFLKNGDLVENILGKKLIFFLAIFTFLWRHWMRNKISCPRDIYFFFLSIFDQKL